MNTGWRIIQLSVGVHLKFKKRGFQIRKKIDKWLRKNIENYRVLDEHGLPILIIPEKEASRFFKKF